MITFLKTLLSIFPLDFKKKMTLGEGFQCFFQQEQKKLNSIEKTRQTIKNLNKIEKTSTK